MSTKVLKLLKELEEALKKSGLWQTDRPSDEALRSVQPFCIDTLAFEQWLQFVFLPKIREMIEKEMPLPKSVALAPMAEHAFASHTDFTKLHSILCRIDTAFKR